MLTRPASITSLLSKPFCRPDELAVHISAPNGQALSVSLEEDDATVLTPYLARQDWSRKEDEIRHEGIQGVLAKQSVDDVKKQFLDPAYDIPEEWCFAAMRKMSGENPLASLLGAWWIDEYETRLRYHARSGGYVLPPGLRQAWFEEYGKRYDHDFEQTHPHYTAKWVSRLFLRFKGLADGEGITLGEFKTLWDRVSHELCLDGCYRECTEPSPTSLALAFAKAMSKGELPTDDEATLAYLLKSDHHRGLPYDLTSLGHFYGFESLPGDDHVFITKSDFIRYLRTVFLPFFLEWKRFGPLNDDMANAGRLWIELGEWRRLWEVLHENTPSRKITATRTREDFFSIADLLSLFMNHSVMEYRAAVLLMLTYDLIWTAK